jgi:hypothetical protein
MKDPQTESALNYFDYLAKCFPVMCASDEFHFLPRVERASQYYDQIDNLDADVIEECLFNLREFQDKFDRLASHENDFEKLTDLELLKANAAGILIELEMKQSWRNNPLLYLKIAFMPDCELFPGCCNRPLTILAACQEPITKLRSPC